MSRSREALKGLLQLFPSKGAIAGIGGFGALVATGYAINESLYNGLFFLSFFFIHSPLAPNTETFGQLKINKS